MINIIGEEEKFVGRNGIRIESSMDTFLSQVQLVKGNSSSTTSLSLKFEIQFEIMIWICNSNL